MKNKFGTRLKPTPSRLEQRFVFDGAVAADAAKAVHAIATPNATLAVDSFNGVSSAFALDAVTKYADLIAPTNLVDGNQFSYRVTKDGVAGAWQSSYAAPKGDGTQDGHYQVDIKQVDSNGNESAIETIDFVLSSLAPDVPNASLVNSQSGGLDNGYDTNLVSADGSLASPSNVAEGSLLEYRVTYSGQDSGWQSSYQSPLADGTTDGVYNVQVRQTDIAGNVSAVESIDFTLDSSLAEAVSQAAPDTSPPLTSPNSLDLSTGQSIIQHSNEILFVDTTVAGYQALVSDSRSGIDVYLLDPNQDPWAQMTDVISHYQNVSAVHLASHGSSGEIIIGDKAFGVAQLDSVSADLATWQSHMTANADMLLYGCDIASGDAGAALVNELHVLTQENIAASTDTTGSSDLGGNWVLEAKSSTVRTASAFNDLIYQDYKYELNAGTFSAITGSNVDTTGVTSGLIGAGKVIQFDPITVTTTPTSSGQLIIRAYDVDYGLKDSSGNYYAIGNANSEWDGVYLKGPTDTTFKFIGYLNGTNNNWSYSTFDVKSIMQTQGAGQYSVRIIPDDNGTQTQTSNGGRWVVGTSLASFVLDGGAHTAASISALAESTSTVSATVMPTASGNYTIQFILIDPSGRGAAQVDTALTNLTANVSKSFTATLVANSNFYSSWASLPTGNYTLQATLIDSSGVVQDTKTYAYSNVQTVGGSTARILISGLTPSSWIGSSSADVAHLATTLSTPTIVGAFPSAPSTKSSTTVSVYDGATLLGTVSVARRVKSWSFAIPASKALSVGTHTITAAYTVSSGGGGGSTTYTSQNYSLVVDSIYGVKPVITGLTSASWTGSSSADVAKTATTDLNPTLVGTAGANETIYIYDGSTLLGATSANSSGAWTFDVPLNVPLTNGSHSFVAKDSAFNLTSSVYTLSIDSIAPTTTVSGIHISADTGSSSVDFVTGTATQDISATLSAPLGANEILQGVVGGVSISNIAVASNVVTVTTSSAHGYSVGDVVDISASTNTAINGTFTITGVTSTTFTYSDSTANISSVDAGAVLKWLPVSVASGSTSVLWTSRTLSGGYFDNSQYTPWSIQFRVVNTSVTPNLIGSVASQSYQLLTGSGAPVISTINASNSSSVVTNNIYPAITGTADAGSLVAISAGSSLLGRVAADSTGHWSFIPPSSFAEGVYSITAVETIPLSGYTSSASSSKSLTIDTTAPSVAVTAISPDTAGSSSSDFITSSAGITFSGTLESGTTASLPYLDGVALSTSGGKLSQTTTTWTYNNSASAIASDGSHVFSIVATDTAGNAATISKTFVVDSVAPTVSGGSVNGSVVKLAFSDVGSGLASTIAPVASSFVVKNSLNQTITVNSLSIDNPTNTVTLNLASSISGSATVLYTKPSSGNALQDAAGNAVATFGSAQTVADISLDTTPPAAPGAITLATASNSGITSDSITNVTTPTVNVALSASNGTTAPVVGDLVKVYLSSTSGTLLGTGVVTAVTVGSSNTTSAVAVSLSSLGADGIKSLVATETDAKGNVSTVSSGANVTVDTVAPLLSTATVNGSSLVLTYMDTNGVYATSVPSTSDYTVLVNGASAALSRVSIAGNVVTLTLSTAVFDSDAVSIGYTPGTYKLQDASANLALALNNASVTNQTAPSTLAITGTGAGLMYDTGSSSSDSIANNGALQVNGLENTGSNYVQYQLNSGSWASLAPGVTQFTPTYASNGSQTVTVRQVSGAGVVSATSSITFTYDTVAPTAPTLALTTDSGLSASDKITNSGAVTVSGLEGASGTTWQYSTDGGLTWSAGSGSAVTLSGDGSKTITVKETDVAGNISTTSTPLAFTLDGTTPTLSQATINGAAITLSLADSGGNLNSGLTGVPASSAFTFTNSSNAPITPTISSISVDSTNKLVTINLSAGLSGSGNKIIYTAPSGASNALQDIAGNRVASFTAQTLTDISTDTIAPATPGAITLATASNSGITSDSITNVTTPTVNVALSAPTSGGTAPVVGDLVKVYLSSTSGVLLGTGTVTSTLTSGSNTTSTVAVSLSSLGSDGIKSLVATETDAKGNVSTVSSGANVTVDTVAPLLSTATVNGSSLVLTYVDTNGVNSSKVPAISDYAVLVNGASATVSSVGISGSAVTLTLSTAVADTDTVSINYAPGTNKLQDASANLALALNNASVTNQTAPSATGISLNSDTGYSASDLVSSSGVINISGLESGDYVQYQLNSGSWASLAPGVTQFTPTYASNGSQTVTVRQVSGAGVVSATSSITFTYDTVAPTAPTLALTTDSGLSASDKITNSGAVTVSGLEGASGTTWQYSTDGGLTWSAGSGSAVTLSGDGSKTITVKETDVAGNISTTSTPLAFTLDTAPPVLSRAVSVTSTQVRVYLADNGGSGVDFTSTTPDKSSFVAYDNVTTFTGSVSGTTLTVTSLAGGVISSSLKLNGIGVTSGTTILSQLSGTTGGVGTYTTSRSQTVASTSMGLGNVVAVTSLTEESATNSVLLGTASLAARVEYVQPLSNGLKDIAGNLMVTTDPPVVHPTVAAAAPTLSLLTASDSGVTSDSTTNVTTPFIHVLFNGSGSSYPLAGDIVTLYLNPSSLTVDAYGSVASGSGAYLGAATIQAADLTNGYINIQTSALGVDGTKNIVAAIGDQISLSSALSSTLALALDTTAPVLSSGTIVGDSASGTSAINLNYTETASGLLSNQAPAASDFAINIGGVSYTPTNVSFGSGKVVLTLGFAVSDSVNATVTYTPNSNTAYRIQDQAGNYALSLSATSLSNNSTPATPTVGLASGNDSGSSMTDGVTNLDQMLVSGYRVGSTVYYRVDGGSWVSLSTPSGASTSFTPTGLADGVHTIDVKQVTASTVTSSNGSFSFTYDTTVPAEAIDSTLMVDNKINLSESGVVTISGTAEAGSAVTISLADSAATPNTDGLTVTTLANGTWSAVFDLTASTGSGFSDGTVHITATATDLAGNSTTSTKSLTLDATPPVLATASVASTTLTLTYTEVSSGIFAAAPSASDFTVTKGSGNTPVVVSSVAVDAANHKVKLTLASAITNADSHVLVSYNPGSDANAIQDIAGNLATSLSGQAVTVNSADTTPPAAPTLSLISDSGSSGTDAITNVTAPVIRVALNGSGATAPVAGDTVAIFSGVTQIATYSLTSTDVSTNYYADITLIDGILGSDGSKSLTAKITDSADNISLASSALSITLDTTVSAPVISGITTDSGSSSTDGITNDTSLTIVGTAEASSVVTVSANGVLLGTTTTDGSGNWSYIDLDTLSNGNSYSFTASATDVAGNMSSNSNTYVAVIDTVAPNAPIISGITTDTGSSTTDGITSDTSLTINGTAEANSTVSVYVGGSLSGTTTADSSGNWHYVDLGTLANGNSYSFTAKATDTAGNLSLFSNAFVASIDTAAPSAPVISGIATDTGSSSSDGITSDTSLTINGTAEANSVVTLSANGVALGTTVVNGSGAWSYVDTDALLDAHTYSFTAKATDTAGNLSMVSNTFVASIDTVAPTAPLITGITTDSGRSSTDHITNDTSLTIAGTAEANSTVSVYVSGSTLLGTAVANGSGAWSYVDPATLADGNTYSFTATATDAAGNIGVTSSAFIASIDTIAPSLSAAGVLDSTLTLTYAEMGSGMFATAPSASDFTVTTGVGNTSVAVSSVSVDAAHRKVNLTLASAITNGDTNVLVSYSPGSDANAIQDIAGNLANSLSNQAVTINSADTTPTAAPTLSLISDSGSSSIDKITNATAPVIRVALNGSGATAPLAGDTVDIYSGLTNIATYALTSTDVGVNYYADITLIDGILGLDGSKSLTAKITDSSNNVSAASSVLSIVLDTTVSAPVISGFTADSGSSLTDGITNDTSLTINGTADANCVISVYVGGSLSGTTTSDGSGNWSYIDLAVLSNGTSYSFTAKAVDVAGNLSLTSNARVAQIDTVAPSAPVILSISPDTGSSTTDGITNATSLTVNGTAEAGSMVSVYVGGTLSGTTTADNYGNWHYVDPATLLDAHSYSFTAKATDAAGNASGDSNAYVARIDASAPSVPVIAGITTDSGRSRTDGITNDTNLTINGTAEVNGIVSIFVGGTLSGTTMADGSGNWSYSDPEILSNGNSYSYTATTTDEVGNTSGASTVFIATIDTAAPSTPVISGITTDSGSLTSDGITNDTSLTITGTAEANSTVSVYVGGSTLLGSTTANGSGAWSYADPATLVDGNSYSFTATATDAAGNTGSVSSPLVASIDVTAPNLATAGVSSSTLTLAYTETGSGMFTIAPSASDFTVTKGTGNTPVTVSSVAIDAVNKAIVLTLSSSVSSADSNIKVSYSSGSDTHAIQDIAGNKALNIVAHDVSNLLGDITAPSAPAISLAAVSDSGLLGDSRTNISTPVMRVNLTGVGATAPVENDRVIIYLVSGSSRTQIASYLLTATDISNQFSNVAVSGLGADGTKSLTAVVVDQAGNTSADSNTAAIVLDRTGPVLISTTINSAYLTLDYSWSGLDSNSGTPTPADYTVRVNGQSRAILAVSVNTTTRIVTITVDSPVLFGDVVTVDYSNVSGHVIEDAQGNVAANFSNQAVTLQNLAWINNQNFTIASAYDGVTNTIAPDPQSLISMVVTNSSNSIDTSAITQNISVVHSNVADQAAPDYIPKPVAPNAATSISAAWDPIVFSVLPQDIAVGLQDINTSRAGTQINVVIDISRANIPADGFNAYMKYLSADTIQNYLNAHVALVTLDGVTITSTSQAGWYDFTQRAPGGDGARFVTSNGKITSVVITLTDNAFGDDNLTVGNIVDPGMPVYEVTTAFSPATSVVNNFHLLDANLKFNEVQTAKWNLATSVGEEGYRPLLFVDPEKSMTSHLVSTALFYGEGLDYSSIIENAQYSDRVLSEISGKQFANKDFKQSWKSGIDIQNSGYISLGLLDQHKIIKVSPAKDSSLPDWLKIDEAGRVYIAAESRDQKLSAVIVKISILGSDGQELILYKEISSSGIKSVAKPQDKELLSNLNKEPILKFGANGKDDFSDLQFSIPSPEKQAVDRKNKMKFNQQIRQAKDELYALNIVS